jgi:nucleoside 2-deoxyribosyltransferase
MKVYVASGWFTPEQEKARKEILRALNKFQVEFYSPKEDCLAKPDDGGDVLQSIFKENVDQIRESDYIVASTVGKDMGTLFECGYAHALEVPIIYYAPGLEGNFNLMLARSAHNVATSVEELEYIIEGNFPYKEYKGVIE